MTLFVAMEQALEDINSRLNNPGSVADVAKRGNREVEFRLPRARSREGFGGTLTVGAEGVSVVMMYVALCAPITALLG